uniref:F-box domain-containing protein n=1 Tax=Opuntia streptacantha TaxID=393608 RepID=A0A7C9DAS0_OPUST
MEEFSGDLPMELVTELLVRLPVKSLVRFRCVCKEWCSLISSPDFASLHLTRYHNNDDDSPLLAATIDVSRKFQWMLLSGHTYGNIVHDDYAILNNQKIMAHIDTCDPRGSPVNGLLLLSKRSVNPAENPFEMELMLWNPMIGKTHKLPAHCIDYDAYLGLGFSHSRNDYKVVAISRQPKTSVYVYSVSTRTWSGIVEYREDIIHEVFSDGFLLVEGIMHFLSVNFFKRKSHMVLFDVSEEAFSYIELPCDRFDSYAVVYRGMIGLLDFDYREYSCDLWVMENDRVPCSWHKLYAVDFEPGTAPRMLCFKENGEFLLAIEKGGVELRHFERKLVEQIRENSSCLMVYASPYKESLVLL